MGEEALAELTRIIWFPWQSSSRSGYDSLKLTRLRDTSSNKYPWGSLSMLNRRSLQHGSHISCQKKESILVKNAGSTWQLYFSSSIDLHINDLASQEACLLGDSVLSAKSSNPICLTVVFLIGNEQIDKHTNMDIYIYTHKHTHASVYWFQRIWLMWHCSWEMTTLSNPSISDVWKCKVEHQTLDFNDSTKERPGMWALLATKHFA